MAIKISRRAGPATCPLCLDSVDQGTDCPACCVTYHLECAATFGRCGIIGCRTPFEPSRPSGRALPRLAAMAGSLAALRATSAPSVPDDDVVVALLPGPRKLADRPDAAAAVGEALGQTAYDGRLRLGSPLPELLLRVDGPDNASRIRERLTSFGVRALTLPAAALLRPLDRVEVAEVDPATLRVLDTLGRLTLISPERLVITAQRVEVRTREKQESSFDGERSRTTTRRQDERIAEPVAIVFNDDDPTPLLFRRDNMRVLGGAEPTAFARWTRVVTALSAVGDRLDLAGTTSAVLQTRKRPFGPVPIDENLPGLLLASRILHLAWRAGEKVGPA